jgi:hypothetical protein
MGGLKAKNLKQGMKGAKNERIISKSFFVNCCYKQKEDNS